MTTAPPEARHDTAPPTSGERVAAGLFLVEALEEAGTRASRAAVIEIYAELTGQKVFNDMGSTVVMGAREPSPAPTPPGTDEVTQEHEAALVSLRALASAVRDDTGGVDAVQVDCLITDVRAIHRADVAHRGASRAAA